MASQVSLTTHLNDFWQRLPLLSRSIFCLCVSIYVVQLLTGWNKFGVICLSASAIVERYQLYRAFTAIFFHANVLHVTFNMMAWVSIGAVLERAFGTFLLACISALILVLSSIVYVGISYVVAAAGYLGIMRQCAIGFSGVLFGLLAIENHVVSGHQRSLFGLVAVPKFAYPWVLVVVWQLLVPQASLVGHLSGLAVGQMVALGWLHLLLPTSDRVQELEQASAMAGMMGSPSYIANTNEYGMAPFPSGMLASEPLLPETSLASRGVFEAMKNRLAAWLPGSSSSSSLRLWEREREDQQQSTGNEGPRGHLLGGEAPRAGEPRQAAAEAAQLRAGGGLSD